MAGVQPRCASQQVGLKPTKSSNTWVAGKGGSGNPSCAPVSTKQSQTHGLHTYFYLFVLLIKNLGRTPTCKGEHSRVFPCPKARCIQSITVSSTVLDCVFWHIPGRYFFPHTTHFRCLAAFQIAHFPGNLSLSSSLPSLFANYSFHTKLSKTFFPVSTPRNRAAFAGKARIKVGPSPAYRPETPRCLAIFRNSPR